MFTEGTSVTANIDIENEFAVDGTADDVVVDTVKAGTAGVVYRVSPRYGIWVDFEGHPEGFLCARSELDINNDD